MPKIILASTSPRRHQLLKHLGLKFKIVASDYEEEMHLKKPPKELVKYLSLQKALAVIDKHPRDLIIAADTIIVFKNKIIGKPHLPSKAKATLKKLSGKKHQVITGYTLIHKKKKITRAVSTQVEFKKLSTSEINNYVKTKEPLDKAGAYAIQGLGTIFVKNICGDYFNVIGLPLYALSQDLKKFKINIL